MSHPQAGKHNGSNGELTRMIQQEPLLDVEDLQVHFPLKSGGLFSRSNLILKAVDGVSFTIYRGGTRRRKRLREDDRWPEYSSSDRTDGWQACVPSS
jgi:hypothetical protein